MPDPSPPRLHPFALAVPLSRAHELIGCSRQHFWRLDKGGGGPPVADLDGVRVIRLASLDHWLAGREPKTRKAPKARGRGNG